MLNSAHNAIVIAKLGLDRQFQPTGYAHCFVIIVGTDFMRHAGLPGPGEKIESIIGQRYIPIFVHVGCRRLRRDERAFA